MRRATAPAVRLLLPRLHRPDEVREKRIHGKRVIRFRPLRRDRRHVDPHARQRARHHRLAARAATQGSDGEAPRRLGLHRPGRRAHHAAPALRHRRSAPDGRAHFGKHARPRLHRLGRAGEGARRLPAVQRGSLSVRDQLRLAPAVCRSRKSIQQHGIRNSHLLSIAPTGTISLAFADNASNGIEPPFSWTYTRKKRVDNGWQEYSVEDHAYRRYRATGADMERPARRTSSPRWRSARRRTSRWSRPWRRSSTPASRRP